LPLDFESYADIPDAENDSGEKMQADMFIELAREHGADGDPWEVWLRKVAPRQPEKPS